MLDCLSVLLEICQLINYYLLFWTMQEVIGARRHFTQAEVDWQLGLCEGESLSWSSMDYFCV